MKQIILHHLSSTGIEYATESFPIEEVVGIYPDKESSEDKVRVYFIGGDETEFGKKYGDLGYLSLDCSYVDFA